MAASSSSVASSSMAVSSPVASSSMAVSSSGSSLENRTSQIYRALFNALNEDIMNNPNGLTGALVVLECIKTTAQTTTGFLTVLDTKSLERFLDFHFNPIRSERLGSNRPNPYESRSNKVSAIQREIDGDSFGKTIETIDRLKAEKEKLLADISADGRKYAFLTGVLGQLDKKDGGYFELLSDEQKDRLRSIANEAWHSPVEYDFSTVSTAYIDRIKTICAKVTNRFLPYPK